MINILEDLCQVLGLVVVMVEWKPFQDVREWISIGKAQVTVRRVLVYSDCATRVRTLRRVA